MRLWPATACERVRRDASTFLDGRLAAARRATMQQHLQACGGCVRELQQLARLSRAMHNLPSFRLADGMSSRLRRALAAAPLAETAPVVVPVAVRCASKVAACAAAAAACFWFGYVNGRAEAVVGVTPAGQPGVVVPAPLDTMTQAPRSEGRGSAPRVEPSPMPAVEPAPFPNARFADFDHRQRAQPRFAGQDPEAPPPAGRGWSDAHELLEQMLREMFGDELRRDLPRR